MQKFLRTLMLAALLLPFASQAQTMYLTVADSTATNDYVPVYGLYVDDFVRCQTVYPADMLTDLTGETILGLTYYLGTPAASSWGVAQFVVNVKEVTGTTLSAFEDMTGATTVYTGSLDATQATMEIEFNTPYIYQGGNLLIEIYNTLEGTYKSASFYGKNVTGASWQGNNGTSVDNITGAARAFMPKTTFVYGTAPTCFKVQNLTASDITSSSITLSWDDTINSGATYTIYDMSDTTVVNVTIVDNTAIIDELDANTVYTFGVQTDCGAGDIANGYTVVSTRTACSAEELPFIEDFSASLATDPCWRGASGTTAAEAMAGTALTLAANSQWVYSNAVSNGLEAGHYRVNIYGTNCKNWMITPTIDFSTASSPLLSFDAAFTAYSGTGVATGFENNATQLFMILASTDNGQTWDSVASISLASIASTSYIRQYVDLSEYAGDTVRIAFYAQSTVSGGDNNLHVDNVSIDESTGDICYPISGMTVSDLTSNSATLTWNASADSYTLSFTDGTDTTDYTYYDTVAEFYTLLPNTQYTAIIVANCSSDNESDPVSFTFRTNCGAEELPFIEDFSASLANDPCWNGADVLYTDSVEVTLTANNKWTYSSSVSNGLPAGHYRVNIYGTGCKKWMITPTIDLTEATSPLLSFDAAFTKYSGTAVADGDITDDKFLILVSTNNGQTWTTASNINLSSLASLTYLTQYVDLSAYVGDTVRVAFYAESTVSGGDNNLHIDNISIDELVGDLCLPVSGLDVDDVTAEGATLSWNGTAAGSYTVVNMADGSVVTSGADTTYTLTGLTAMTQYSYGVVANCTSSNSDTMVVTFNTACTALTLPYTEGFELTSNAIGCWSVEGTGSWTVGTGDYSASTGAFEGTYNAKITHGTTGNATKLVSPALDGVENGMMLDFAYVMRAWSGDVDELRVYTRASETAAWQMIAEYTDAAATWTVANLIIPGTVYQVAFEFTDNYGYGVGIDSVVFTPMSGSFCFPVADLAVDSVTATSVFLSWSDENNTGATYSIYGDEGNVIATNVAGTSYEVTGLTALTGYTFGVAANCSAEESSDVATIGAVTGCASTTCDVYIYAVDGYGDGWNDATIEVKQAGVVVASYSMADQGEEDVTVYDTAVVEVCASAPVALYWISGEYDDEIAFTIADYNGDSLYAVDSASNLIDGATFFNLTAPCGEVEADSLTVVLMVNDSTLGSITPAVGVYRLALGDSITLTATPYGDNVFNGWLTYVDGEVMATLPINPFTFSANVNNVNHTMLMIAQFAAAGAAPDSVTVIINVDNPLMGTTSPAPGTYRVAVGDPLDMVALPNAGFHNLYWIESATFMGTTFTDTLAYDTLNFFASPMMANATLNYTAYFEANPPVESTIDASEITYWVGTGSNQAVVAVNWSNGAYAWGVRFNGESITVQDALDSMAAYDYRFDYSADSYLNNITFDEGNLHLTGLLGSFWESKHNGISDMGLAQTLVNGDFEKWAEPAAGVVTDSVYYDGWGWSYIYTYTMSILPMWAPEPESISLTFNVNDPTLGSINPSGVRIFEVGDELTVTATPAEGCSFVSWTVTTAQGETMTLQRDMASFTDTVEATWNGSTLTANFVRNQGIDEVESADFQAYSLNGKVIVKGVENMDVNVYDVTGRSVNNVAKATETVEFTVPAAGVYMVKVGNAVKRVVVIR